MARISASAEGTTITTAFDSKEFYPSHIIAKETATSKVQEDGSGGNPMMYLTWEIDDGPYKGRTVPYHLIMLGGTTKKGQPMPIHKLLEVIEGTKVGWATSSSAPLVARPFKKVKADDGSIYFVDPDTNQKITNIEFDDEQLMNKRAKVRYGIKKQQGSDREFNEVDSVMPL